MFKVLFIVHVQVYSLEFRIKKRKQEEVYSFDILKRIAVYTW